MQPDPLHADKGTLLQDLSVKTPDRANQDRIGDSQIPWTTRHQRPRAVQPTDLVPMLLGVMWTR